MGEYRTFSQKSFKCANHLDGSALYGNAKQKGSKSCRTLLTPKWSKCKKSPYYQSCLILWIFASLLHVCQGSPVDSITDAGNFSGTDTQRADFALIVDPDKLAGFTTEYVLETNENCTPTSADEFPADLFTLEQRQNGAIVLHFIAIVYALYALLLVCDWYFVPAIECICEELRIAPNVAGATFMAISTSAPELFTNVIGTFVTKGDLGVGTIVGSAVFNILAVGSCIGIGTNFAAKGSRAKRKGVPLDWWSLSRDTFYYLVSVVVIILVLYDGRVYWYEAGIMVAVYGLYIAGMCHDDQCKQFTETFIEKLRKPFHSNPSQMRKLSTILRHKYEETTEETSPLVCQKDFPGRGYGVDDDIFSGQTKPTQKVSFVQTLASSPNAYHDASLSSCESESSDSSVSSNAGRFAAVKDILTLPICISLQLTIPDCRKDKMRKWYALSLLSCIVWIGGLSYVLSWMVCIIGGTFGIPDSVSGLTFLAAGTSFPEVLSSVIVARQGLGSMGLSNSIGSNTFDILICLGLPWLIQAVILSSNENNFISIHSSGLEYSTVLLVTCMLVLYMAIAFNDYILDTKVGVTCVITYAIFITIACLLEMNVFFPVNLPNCS